MPTFLITGGAGFIGSHLTEAALNLGHRVLVLDDLSSGSIENPAQVRNHKNLEFVPESVTEKRVLAELVDRADMIFHLAATVGVFNIIESPVTTIINKMGKRGSQAFRCKWDWPVHMRLYVEFIRNAMEEAWTRAVGMSMLEPPRQLGLQ